MFKPIIQKTRTLVSMAIINLILVYWSFNSIIIEKSPNYNNKIQAAKIMEQGLGVLKKHQEIRGIPIFKSIDPNSTGLIPKEESPIRSGNGRLAYKQATLKPNFAALIVDILAEANISRGDTIAVCLTGSMPGANLALYSASKAMGIHPVVITSVAASTWGATDPDLTWLDMEKILNENNIISSSSIAASFGGKGDCLRKNSDVGGYLGRKVIKTAIKRNKISMIPYFINKDSSNITISIKNRMNKFKLITSIQEYDAFINIGGGVSSVGLGGIQKLQKNGLISSTYLKNVGLNNSVMTNFAKAEVPIIHILRISDLIKDILPPAGEKQKIGEGLLYFKERYNLLVAGIATFISLLMIVSVGLYSKHQINVQLKSYEVESII